MTSDAPYVALDVTPLLLYRTGIGRSVQEMVAALEALAGGPRLQPYALGARSGRLRPLAPAGTRFVPLPVRPALAAWGATDRPRVDRWLPGAQVLHATNFVVPPVRVPSVVTVHDCSFALFPDTVNAVVARFGPVLRRAFARGTVAHVTTEAVAAEVEQVFGPGLRAAGQLEVVAFGVPDLGPAGPVPAAARELVGAGPYVLALGRSEPRKNLLRLVGAFAQACPDGDVRLLLAGPDGPDRPLLELAVQALRPQVRRRVSVLGAVDDPTRRALLSRARVLAYPSLYEGFGFPALEAMTLGVPVLAGDVPALAEVTGGAAVLADPLDVTALAGGLRSLLDDDDAARATRVAAGRARAAGFTWDATARGLAALYRRLAGG